MARDVKAARGRKFELGIILMMAASPTALVCSAARAQSALALGEVGAVDFAIPAQPLVDAMRSFSQATGIQAVYSTSIGSGVASPGVSGRMSAGEALSHLLAGTGITYRFTGAQSVTLEPAPQDPSGAIQLGPVRVEGSGQEGMPNVVTPKTDRAATDQSRSYAARRATVAGKEAQELREIPQSVSVVTRQRLDDQNIVSLEDALRQTTGVTAVSYDQTTAYYQVRGFPAEIQYDGIPSSTGASYSNQFDLAMYDRIEVLRGPAGLLQGSSEPAGTVNLVRKRPHGTFGWAGSLSAGSWNNFHGDLDITGPLNSAGTIRGRFVAAAQDRNFFVDKERERHELVYGIVEFDLSPRTTLTLSGAYEFQKENPFDYGQSTYADGRFLNAPRSTFYGLDWSGSPVKSGEGYASLDHDLGNGWKAKASLDYRRYTVDAAYGYIDDYVNDDNSAPYQVRKQYNGSKQVLTDFNVSGPVHLFGREHSITLGVNYSWYDFINQLNATGVTVSNIFDIDIPEQTPPLRFRTDTRTELFGGYGQARISLADPLTLIVGGRVSYYNSEVRRGIPFGAFVESPDVDGHFTPQVGAIYDLDKHWSIYGSYTGTFVPQTNQTASGDTLKPRSGEQFEVGIKGALLNGSLNTSLALFNLTDRNRAYADPNNPDYFLAAGKVRSRGIEAEVSGEPLPGWSVFAGYTYLETKFLDDDTYQGQTFDREEPRHTLKLWSTYRIGDLDRPGFQVGGGVRVMSKTSRGGPVQPAYAIADAQVGYRLNRQWSATVSVTNLFDKRYFVRVPSEFFGFYGEPRAFNVTLRKSF